MARAQDLTFPGPRGSVRAHLARPAGGGGGLPALLVLHEILGLNDDIRRIAARFADAGYVALAPDLFHGDGPRPLCVLRAVASLRRRRGGAFDTLECARRFVSEQPDVDAARIGAAGFCMGGGFAVLFAARAKLGVVATFYGDVPRDAEALRGIAPVVGGYGACDRIFAPQGRRLRAHLAALGVTHDVAFYQDAGHSYMSRHGPWIRRAGRWSPMRAGYDEAAAEDSWRRMLAFFAEHL